VRVGPQGHAHDVLRLMLRDGLKLTGLGVALGLPLAYLVSRLIRSLLFQTPAGDPLTFVSVALTLLAVAALASYLPARRATRVDPLVALRYD
jgi:putative ABC transport system permease protein